MGMEEASEEGEDEDSLLRQGVGFPSEEGSLFIYSRKGRGWVQCWGFVTGVRQGIPWKGFTFSVALTYN